MAVKWTKSELAELQVHAHPLLIGTGVTGSLESDVDESFAIRLIKKPEYAPASMNHSIVLLDILQAKQSTEHATETMPKQLSLKT